MRRRRIRQHQAAQPIEPTITWEVDVKEVRSGDVVAGNYKGLHRSDSGSLINIVKKSYEVASNEMLMNTVDKLSKSTGLQVHGYSTFGSGGVVLGYLENPGGLKIGEWNSDNYMVVGNSFDYSKGFFIGTTNRVHRCSNEFGMIDVKKTIRHNSRLHETLEQYLIYFESHKEQTQKMKEEFETWQGISMSKDVRELFVDKVLMISPEERLANEFSSRKLNMIEDLNTAISREIEAMGQNMWSLFNGVTYYTTHMKNSSVRIFGNVVGPLAEVNSRALKATRELVEEFC